MPFQMGRLAIAFDNVWIGDGNHVYPYLKSAELTGAFS